MKSEIRATREGKFMVVQFDPSECTWGECLAEAFRQHPGCKALPCIAISRQRMVDTSRHTQNARPQQARVAELTT